MQNHPRADDLQPLLRARVGVEVNRTELLVVLPRRIVGQMGVVGFGEVEPRAVTAGIQVSCKVVHVPREAHGRVALDQLAIHLPAFLRQHFQWQRRFGPRLR